MTAKSGAALRSARWFVPDGRRGDGRILGRHILQADQGCDFDFLETVFGAPASEPSIH